MPPQILAHVTAGFDELPALRDEWTAIFEARAHEPSTSHEWTMAMVRNHVRPSDKCFCVRLERDGLLHGFVPLVLRVVPLLGQPVTMLAPLSEEYNTHSDVLVRSADAETMRAMLQAIAGLEARWDYFRLARLLEDGETAMALRSALATGGHAHQGRQGIAAYLLTLPPSYAAYLSARSAKFRNHLKRAERKLAAAGRLEVLDTSDSIDRVHAGLDALMHVEQASWKHSHGSAISAVDHQQSFYREFCLAAHRAGRLHLQWMNLDGQPVAYNLGYVQGDRYHYLKTSYDHALRALSPSTVLRARLIAGLIDRGFREFDFPGEPYEWETQWTDTARWRQVLTVYGRTVRGRLLQALERVRHRPSPVRAVRHVDPRASRPQVESR